MNEEKLLKWKQENCEHEVIEVNPITGDPLFPLLRCVKCGKEEKDYRWADEE